MLIAGIVGNEDVIRTANLINRIFSATDQKVSILDASNLKGFGSKLVKSYLKELAKNGVNFLILKINVADVEQLDLEGFNFSIIIYQNKADDMDEASRIVHEGMFKKAFSLLNDKGLVIFSADDHELITRLKGIQNDTVTYGFNSKASFTTSSTGDPMMGSSVICCLQRTITAINGMLVEPQEYRICVDQNEFEPHEVLAAVTFAVINGVDPNSIDCKTIKQ